MAKNDPQNNEQFLALQAELEAARAEIAALKAGKTKKAAKSTGIPEDQMAPADTLLGKVQRLDRAQQIDAFPKLARLLPITRVCDLIVELSGEVGAATNSDAESVVTTVTTRAPKKEKGAKVVEDSTGGEG